MQKENKTALQHINPKTCPLQIEAYAALDMIKLEHDQRNKCLIDHEKNNTWH